jgi:Na+/H+ antiporter NhaD/arsenite permease-like protein
MKRSRSLLKLGLVPVLFFSTPALGHAAQGPPLDVPVWSIAPFVLLLLCIALLPLIAEHWWHNNRNKAIVSALFALPVAIYLLARHEATQGQSTQALLAEMDEYVSFIVLLASLYIIAGGILLRGGLRPRPWTNTAALAFGAVLTNLIGTTGASMLLIRPFLQFNRQRQFTRHLPVFFIFSVSNVGGLLTPLGDPPLFLGFLKGVSFFWTFSLWRQWLLVNGLVLAVFWCWDTRAARREGWSHYKTPGAGPVRLTGWLNFVFLGGVLAAVLLQSPQLGLPFVLERPWSDLVMAAMAVLSLILTPRGLRREHAFTWGPILEVAIVFAGIFVAMVPALHLLRGHGPALGLNALAPRQYFMFTGLLSAFLDNAPTYLAFATMAAAPKDLVWLAQNQPLELQAISCGAVFMGALTYIGNGPNFMVKAIADEAGFKMPSFFGYLAYSLAVLGPILVLEALIFF